jgi:hypothetical protein
MDTKQKIEKQEIEKQEIEKQEIEKQEIIDTHKFKRSLIFLFINSLALYNSFKYSIYSPVETLFTCNSITLQTNYYIFIFYVIWDLYKMVLSADKKILYRNDLLCHHIACIISSFIARKCLLLSNIVMNMECICLMNYIFREKKNETYLALYRIACIICVRIPISFFINYYNYFYLKQYIQSIDNIVQYEVFGCTAFFLLYDMYLLKQNFSVLLNKYYYENKKIM